MANKAPAFQFYPSDFLSDYNTITMSAEEIGIYILLLSHCWLEGGLPDDANAMQTICKCSTEKVYGVLKRVFYLDSENFWQNKRLDKERKKQKKNSLVRKKAAKSRWDKEKQPMQKQCKSNAKDMQKQCLSSSISISTSSSNNKKTKAKKLFQKPTIEELKLKIAELGYSVDPETFYHHYESKGWKVGNQAMKSWESALVTWQKREGKEITKSRKDLESIQHGQPDIEKAKQQQQEWEEANK